MSSSIRPSSSSIPRGGVARGRHERQAEPGSAARLRLERVDGKPVTVRLRFLLSPVAINGGGRVESVELVRNRLEEQAAGWSRLPTGEHETLECGLVFRSVGYRGVGLPGHPLRRASRADQKRGRPGGRESDGAHVAGTYCAGWIKRGPTGSSARTRRTPPKTVSQLLEDVQAGRISHREEVTAEGVESLLASATRRRCLYPGWTSIDRARTRRRREARPPAGEAPHLGRAARRRRARRRRLNRRTGPLRGRRPPPVGGTPFPSPRRR